MKNERETLIELIKQALNLNIDNCLFMKKLYKNSKETVSTLNKSIRQSKKALEKLTLIKHIEILRAIYGDTIGKLSGYLMLGGTEIASNKLDYFDKTEKGFNEFTAIQDENKRLYEQKLQNQRKDMEAIKNAKAQGKKVEYMYDANEKRARPIIVEKGENNA